jgi:Holliday junction resolvase RusA-like endonuclease
LKLELPLPPALNKCYRPSVTKTGKPFTYKTKIAKQWQSDAALLIKSQIKGNKPFKGDVRVAIMLYLKRDRDIDSSFKLLLDTLEYTNVIENDKQICLLMCGKVKGSEPKVTIEIGEYKYA